MDLEEKGSGLSGLMSMAVPALAFIAAGGGIWYLLHDPGAVRREAPPLPVMQAFLPPPPPPPKEKPPEPEKKLEQIQKPDPTPKEMDAPKPVTINGPAQAGTDAFNLGAGDGSGNMGGGGIGAESYSRYLTSILQSAIEQDDRLNHLVFNAQIAAWVDDSRKLHVRLLQSSGDAKLDDSIVSAAEQVPTLDEEPPGPIRFRIAIHSKRPA